MDRILEKFYTSEDHSTDSWGVFEHVDDIAATKVIVHLTEDEAIDLARILNEEYESAQAIC